MTIVLDPTTQTLTIDDKQPDYTKRTHDEGTMELLSNIFCDMRIKGGENFVSI